MAEFLQVPGKGYGQMVVRQLLPFSDVYLGLLKHLFSPMVVFNLCRIAYYSYQILHHLGEGDVPNCHFLEL